MKYKFIFSTILLTLLVSACNLPVSGQTSAAIASPTEDMQAVPTIAGASVSTEQAVTSSDTRGYVLFAPLRSTTTYLINFDGDVVHTWPSQYHPGNSVYLLGNGDLLRTGSVNNSIFKAGGAGGIVQEMDWNGNVLWQFEYSSDKYLQHHDVAQLPNGNILMIAWDYKTAAEAIAAGRNPNLLRDGALWPDKLVEVDPSTNQIVWQWSSWDHLVQNYDPTKPNYGNPSEHPELIDLNYAPMNGADWTHINAVDYNPTTDQILLSVHNFSEIWIIDHSTTTAEAAGHLGGNSSKGGDLLYRWGNPQAYDAGSAYDQQLFFQHDAHWIASGLPGAGDILIFDNGDRRTRPYSSVEEITLPLNADGSYAMTSSTYGPSASVWIYKANPATDFYANNISGAQRLPDGNTLICDGPSGDFFEVTPDGKTVWTYANSFGQSAPGNAGSANASQNPVFRAMYYAADYVGLKGHDLSASLNVASTQTANRQNMPSTQQRPNQNPVGQRRPPLAAINACSDLSQGAACTFDAPRGMISGTCVAAESQLACRPTGNP